MSSVKEHLNSTGTVSRSTDRTRPASGAGQGFRPLSYNAYRILGLPASATQREIFEAASALRRALKLGVTRTFASDLPWLGPVSRTETDLRDALSRLANPAQRIYERLFWFYDREAVADISKLDQLKPKLDQLIESRTQSGRHDAALLSLAVALRLQPEIRDGQLWTASLRSWKEVVESKEFWSLLMASDLKGDFEQLVTFAEIRELRGRTLQLVSAPVADVARDASARRDYQTCVRSLAVLRRCGLPEKLLARYENDIIGPIEDELAALCEETFNAVGSGPHAFYSKLSCDQTFYKYNHELKPQLKRFLDLAGVESLSVYRLFETVASGMSRLAGGYKAAGDEADALKHYRSAWRLAPPGSIIAGDIEETLRSLKSPDQYSHRTEADYYQHLLEELKQLPLRPVLPLPPTVRTSTPRPPSNLGCGTAIGFLALAMTIGLIFNKSGSRSSTRLPGLYNANTYRQTYNTNIPFPRPQISPLPPPIELEPHIVPPTMTTRTRARRQAKVKKGSAAPVETQPR